MRSRQPVNAFLWLLVLTALLSGCSLVRERTQKVSEDWSRAVRIGYTSLRQPVGLAVDEGSAYLLWAQRQEERTRLTFAQVTPDAQVAVSRTLALSTFFPRLPQLAVADDLHAFLITRVASTEKDGVYHVPLSRDGEILGEPQRLSGAVQTSAVVAVAQGSDGIMHALWDVTDGPGPGIYHQRFASDGSPIGFAQLIGSAGEEPCGQVDASGTLHVAWRTRESADRYGLYYLAIPPEGAAPGQPILVARPRIPVSDVTQPLTLGLDGSHVYILWSQEHRSGLMQGAAELYGVSFPQDQPLLMDVQNWFLSKDPAVALADVAEFPPLSSVALPAGAAGANWSDFIEGPLAFSVRQPGSYLPVLADISLSFRFEDRPQLVLLIFRQGELAAYQFPARTRQYSQRARGVAGQDGQLAMAWIDLEQPGRYSVYYASTAPQVRAVLDQRTANDNLIDAVDLFWGMASGISLIPLTGVILFPLLLICGIFYLTGGDDSLRASWSAQVTLAVAVVVYFGVKILVMSAVLSRPPLLGIIPDLLRPFWMWTAALIVSLLAGLIAWWEARRSERPFLFRTALIFALSDSFLTLLIYGPTFYGE